MKKYYLFGGLTAFVIIFNLGYVVHEIILGDFFKENIGAIQRDAYIIPLVAVAFVLYVCFQAYMLPIYFKHCSEQYHWGLTRTAIVFGTMIGLFWDGLQGGIIEVATLKMPIAVFFIDSTYHTLEGTLTALVLSSFYKRNVMDSPGGR